MCRCTHSPLRNFHSALLQAPDYTEMQLAFPEVNNNLFCFVDVQYQIVPIAPVHQMIHIISVGQLIVILDEAEYCVVVGILYLLLCRCFYLVGWESILQPSTSQSYSYPIEATTALGCVSLGQTAANSGKKGVGGVLYHLYKLGSVCKKIEQPVGKGIFCGTIGL